MTPELERRPFTTAEYHRLIEAGILTEMVAIEVADTTVESDRAVKIPSYAEAGIPEAWLIDLYNDRIEIHSNPASGIYQEVRIALRGHKVVSPALPQLEMKADDILR
jgi:Uma2 family endonuclease